MAVGVGERSFGTGADMREDERRNRLARQSFQIPAIPCWDGGSEDAGLRAQIYTIGGRGRGRGVGVSGGARRVIAQPVSSGPGRPPTRGGVVAHTEAVAVMGACRVEAESRVVGLGENGVGGAGDEVGEEDGRLARVDEETAHGRPPFGMEVDGKMDGWIGKVRSGTSLMMLASSSGRSVSEGVFSGWSRLVSCCPVACRLSPSRSPSRSRVVSCRLPSLNCQECGRFPVPGCGDEGLKCGTTAKVLDMHHARPLIASPAEGT